MSKQQQHKERITRLQGRMAVASFAAGIIIACICLFVVPPPGEISASALSVVSECLILAGALLGVQLAVDAKLQKFLTQARQIAKDPNAAEETEEKDE